MRDLFGIDTIRAAQSHGKWSQDLLQGLKNCYHEVKFYARHSVLRWMDQAEKDCAGQVPVLMLRENGNPEWYLVIRMSDSYRFSNAVLMTPNCILSFEPGDKQGTV